MSMTLKLASERAAARRLAAEMTTVERQRQTVQKKITGAAEQQANPKPENQGADDAMHVRLVLRAWRRYAAIVGQYDSTLALQSRVLLSDLTLRGFDAEELSIFQRIPEAEFDAALAELQWESLVALMQRAVQCGALSIAQLECVKALHASVATTGDDSDDGNDWSFVEEGGEGGPVRAELEAAREALRHAHAEAFVAAAEEDSLLAARGFSLWVPCRPPEGTLKGTLPPASTSEPSVSRGTEVDELAVFPLLFRLCVQAGPQRQRPAAADQPGAENQAGDVDQLQLTATVDVWGAADRRDEVVLGTVASALIEALRPATSLPLLAQLMQSHHERRVLASCEAQLEHKRGRAPALRLRADERWDRLVRPRLDAHATPSCHPPERQRPCHTFMPPT